MKTIFAFILLLFLSFSGMAQKPLAQNPYELDTFNVKRARFSVGLQTGVATTASAGLYFLWYAGYEQSRFHWLNDNYGWLQIDKFGHVFTNYHIMSKSYAMNRWSGYNKKKSLLIGFGVAYGFQTLVEVFDGVSAAWGASLGDIASNTLGMGSFVAQELLWDEQRFIWKFSFKPSNYSNYNSDIQIRTERLFGTGLYQTFLKDYNMQTHWLSINPRSFSAGMNWIPEWLNLAFGYSGEGMFGANWNAWYTADGCYENYEHLPRYRQYYFSLDIDWERVPTRSKFLKAAAPFLNMIKVPFPAIEYSRIDGLRGKAFYF